MLLHPDWEALLGIASALILVGMGIGKIFDGDKSKDLMNEIDNLRAELISFRLFPILDLIVEKRGPNIRAVSNGAISHKLTHYHRIAEGLAELRLLAGIKENRLRGASFTLVIAGFGFAGYAFSPSAGAKWTDFLKIIDGIAIILSIILSILFIIDSYDKGRKTDYLKDIIKKTVSGIPTEDIGKILNGE